MIPVELEESAVIDGATPLSIITRILVPLTKPAIATVTIYNFVPIWNDVFSRSYSSRQRKTHSGARSNDVLRTVLN